MSFANFSNHIMFQVSQFFVEMEKSNCNELCQFFKSFMFQFSRFLVEIEKSIKILVGELGKIRIPSEK